MSEDRTVRQRVVGGPSAGILILNWNGRDLLDAHLPSVIAAAAHSDISVVVADNGSTDLSLEFLARSFPGVGTIELDRNYGFGGGYNRAMTRVPWDVVILLNNDMLVAEDFADHLLAPFCGDDQLFAVSAQVHLQDPTARREETGRTSARFHRGELQCAHLPVEEGRGQIPVLWLGGGSAAVSREKFEALGGFEELYSPFYMEDVDLSFRAWQHGWPTVLAPESRVVHRHRGTTGRLDPRYVETIIARNRTVFVALNFRDRRLLLSHAIWLLRQTVLRLDGSAPDCRAALAALRMLPAIRSRRREAASHAVLATERDVLARFAGDWQVRPEAGAAPAATRSLPAPEHADARTRRLSVLFFIPLCVYPVSHGGASRIMNTVWGLSRRGHDVHLVSLVKNEEERRAMLDVPHVASSASYVLPAEQTHALGGMLPTIVSNTYRPSAARVIRDALHQHDSDVLVLEYTHSGAYLAAPLGVPTILVEHDIAYLSALRGALRLDGLLARARSLFDVARLYRWELQTAKRADLVLTASEREAEILRRRGVDSASSVVPNGVDVRSFTPPTPRHEVHDILFVGYFLHPPNIDGLEFFVDSIWPHLRGDGPGLSTTIVGSGLPPDLVKRIEAEGFRHAGYVEDLAAELWSHRVFVCPIRFGAGTRVKLLEAAAARCAIVSTTIGAEGLGLTHGHDVLLADDPAEFARAIRRLLEDEHLRARLGDAAYETVRAQFDWPVLAGRFEQVCYDLLEG